MRRLVARIAAIITSGVTALAFWLSFTALTDLVTRAGVHHTQAWAWPVVVDGITVVATMSVMGLRGRAGYGYAWAMLIASSSVSLAGNVVHAMLTPTDMPIGVSVGVAAVPPLAMLASTHLTIKLLQAAALVDSAAPDRPEVRHPQVSAPAAPRPAPPAFTPDLPAVAGVRQAEPEPRPRHAAPSAPEPGPEAAPAAATLQHEAPHPDDAAADAAAAEAEELDRAAQAARLREAGLSYRKIGDKLGYSERQVRRDVKSVETGHTMENVS